MSSAVTVFAEFIVYHETIGPKIKLIRRMVFVNTGNILRRRRTTGHEHNRKHPKDLMLHFPPSCAF